MKRYLKWEAIAVIVILIGIQFIPVSKTNPPVTRAVKWNSPETQALAQRACNDCHSNLTTWPWDSHIAPSSWLIANHVSDGRRRLNFSQWDQPNADFEEVSRVMKSGEMPLWDYVLMHSTAQLTPVETQQLLDGLQATFQQDPPIPHQRRTSN